MKILENITIESMSHDGRGIARVAGKTTFVTGALTGERVNARMLKKHRHFDEAIAEEILEQSNERVTPRCAHYGVCGGCSLQHIDGDEQVALKQAALLNQFERSAKLVPKSVADPIIGPKWGYRHKARLGVRYVAKKEKVLVGFREHQGRFLADVTYCHVLHPSVGAQLPAIAAWIASLSIFHDIPQIEVAVGDNHTALIIRHLKPFTDDDLSGIESFATTYGFHIYLQPKGPDSITKYWPKDDD
ncbi:MAG: 23S rRNA (uracil(1939)-C(5))-methyltransferase RlmD, partial [Coxiellaceae bacterium]|nr:23S rRNA (uracil(1939)-C(5))-methyltransferase RlmD [Coxiellaceae bacterium]